MSTLINSCRVHRGLEVLPELAAGGGGPVALAHDAALDGNPGLAECRRLLADNEVVVRSLAVHQPRTLADAEVLAGKLAGTRLVVAVGGGSLLDTAKLALAVADPQTARIVSAAQRSGWVIGPDRPRPLPLVAVPTTLGTAAEVSSIVSFVHRGQKRALTSLALQPNVALLDPRCTEGLPGQLLVESCLEIILRSVGPVVGSEGPWTDTDEHALRLAARVAEVLNGIRSTGTATAAQRAELSDLSLATRQVELLRDRMPFTVKVWFLANNLSHHLGLRKMTALANLVPVYWSHLAARTTVGAQRVGRTWSSLRAATPEALPADPAEGVAAWLDLLGVAPAPAPDNTDIEAVVRSCLRMWGGGLPMLAGLGAEDLRRMLGRLRIAHTDSRVPRG
ncbi:daptide-type RiPP biosynthesis dehydogenase [Streptomyces ureilyticus]|uniref:Iron-containing alcohol dehydrogenase n=1 Tax=Streptomyces ureilyticus TaxID=1775131 RepID=A0ABX0DYY4_9ACTN|nr:daptide-type RiPP biosynthesis dehydogenase [Streptomyces ureilyticus]NGO46567.1 iron-containing alcohol dehydrogenase [Streptomyces ureilyticus]